ncbi:uncharacterized protein (DUF1015 family) [Tamaricihabitans halophyticus]|uniref:Uncharacterized protein (DUF1015 family) n=1 Tax=Tamaricihabitans halophyticus TaxID=1262583 RepID=A0A4R2RBL0_9PSEU|nr:DUF1015 family protein [Tamaricihabitans halophyticus]TCP57111.1 uncharacterized protein (DUF1015 family) [Tamaricihabitans halophyticus]
MSTAHAAVPARQPVDAPRIAVRPPRVFVANQNYAGAVHEPVPPERVRQLCADGAYTSVPVPSVVVYRVGSGAHWQTGVIAEVSIEDYRAGRIRRHESTQPERERRLDEYTEAAGIEQVPVTLTHPTRATLRGLLAEVASSQPDVHVVAGGLAHSVWTRHDAGLADAVQRELDEIDALYIADGHHRMAAAERYASRRATPGYTMAALFPSEEMRILGYHRCVTRPAGMSTPDILAALAALPGTARIEECVAAAPAPGAVAVYLDGRWYRLWLRPPRESATPRDELDVVVLDEGILAPLFGVTGADTHGALTLLPGGGDSAEAGRWCAAHDAIGFLLHAPSIEQVMAVSDAGMVMPAKSTWFDPKVAAGLFVRELSAG